VFKDHGMEVDRQPCGVSDQPVPKVWLARVERAQVLRIDLVAAGGLTPQRFYDLAFNFDHMASETGRSPLEAKRFISSAEVACARRD
jgi:hypothetical protein